MVGDYDLNLDVLTLPMSRGYGDVEALPIAMSRDENLLNKVKELVNLDSSQYNSISQKVEEIIFLWSKTDDIDETAMRGSFSAQKLSALEKFRGEDFDAFRGQAGDGFDRSNAQTL